MKIITFYCFMSLVVSYSLMSFSHSQDDKRYVTLISEYKPLNGEVVGKSKEGESLKIKIKGKKEVEELVFHDTPENLKFFEIVEPGDQLNCKVYEGQSRVAIFKKRPDGGIRVEVFFYKKTQ